ncbi:tyrosine--tRNA ligase [Nannocystis radixulma]|uniref:Tyrosine--tRNA ligase n=1 Tax=Nannocystis radixulma TaxID=2995305 RepID=A0ABT5BHJ1_9BACT|nr:tyrosine--tRNA ligase [Nannocystis radixulma]MDC0673143.1 tyrosine--tRNA ligase [Nannocystis radixulma]
MNATPPQPPRSAALQRMLERGYFEQASDFAATDAALDGGMVTFYVGYDPTAASLHVGHLVQIMAMRTLQRAGHKPIIIVGGGTGMIGDPSGKMEARKLLTSEDVAANTAAIREQLGRFLHFDAGKPNDAIMLDNAAWLLELKYIEFLRDVGRHFTVNRMIAVKTYRDRLDAEIPLSFLEFNYQLLQSYDFLHLFRHHGCTLQFGGSDQWGNMVAGVELIRRMTPEGQPNAAYCMTLPLLLNNDGRKMGKTERGAVWLDPQRLSPFEYFQFWIGCDDRDVAKLLRTFTDVPVAEIEALTAEGGAALNAAKARLAYEATALLHGLDHAVQARQASEQAFGSSDDWSAVPLVTVPGPEVRLVDLVTHPDIEAFKSKREARERIAAGAVKLNGEPVTDPAHLVTAAQIGEQGLRLQSGKKCRFRITLG